MTTPRKTSSAPAPRRRRGRAALPESQRKARLIQTRVDDGLDATLREEARRRRLSVSQLIRNVLEDTFQLVDNIVATSASLAETVRRDARRIADSAQGREREPAPPRAPPPRSAPARAVRTPYTTGDPGPLARVDAWQEVLLNRDAHCAICRTRLDRGTAALLGLSSRPGDERLWICRPCGGELAR
jgi:hypothetical protein